MSPAEKAELIADLIGFASGIVLVMPAFRDSRLQRLLHQLHTSRVPGSGGVEVVRQAAKEHVEQKIEQLRPGDFAQVLAGLSLFILSFLIKLVSWLLPDN